MNTEWIDANDLSEMNCIYEWLDTRQIRIVRNIFSRIIRKYENYENWIENRHALFWYIREVRNFVCTVIKR